MTVALLERPPAFLLNFVEDHVPDVKERLRQIRVGKVQPADQLVVALQHRDDVLVLGDKARPREAAGTRDGIDGGNRDARDQLLSI